MNEMPRTGCLEAQKTVLSSIRLQGPKFVSELMGNLTRKSAKEVDECCWWLMQIEVVKNQLPLPKKGKESYSLWLKEIIRVLPNILTIKLIKKKTNSRTNQVICTYDIS